MNILAKMIWCLVFSFVLVACSKEDVSHDDEGVHSHLHDTSEHGHAHAETHIAVTKWSEDFELFAEYEAPIAGGELIFLAHLTRLKGFAALVDASLMLELSGPTTIRVSADKPQRPGFFKLKTKVGDAGDYQGRILIQSKGERHEIDGFSVKVFKDADARAHAKVSEHNEEEILFLKEQQWQIPFSTAFVTRGKSVPMREVAGEVDATPNGHADIDALVGGRVLSPKGGLPLPGQKVKAGEILATIAPTPGTPENGARAELAVIEAEARLENAKATLARAERLFAEKAIAKRRVEEAQRERRVAQNGLKSAKRTKALFAGASGGRGGGVYRIRAPISGTLVRVDVSESQSVKVGDPLFQVVDFSEVWIRAEVLEEYASVLAPNADPEFRISGLDTWMKIRVESGEDSLVNIGRLVDPRSRTVDVIYSLKEPEKSLRIGASLQIAIPVGKPEDSLRIPRSALLEKDGVYRVYVQEGGESFSDRIVRVGSRGGQYVSILSGVREGERVVSKGASFIRLASQANTGGSHGHVH